VGSGEGLCPPQLGSGGLPQKKNCAKNYAILSKFCYFFPILQQKVGGLSPSHESGGTYLSAPPPAPTPMLIWINNKVEWFLLARHPLNSKFCKSTTSSVLLSAKSVELPVIRDAKHSLETSSIRVLIPIATKFRCCYSFHLAKIFCHFSTTFLVIRRPDKQIKAKSITSSAKVMNNKNYVTKHKYLGRKSHSHLSHHLNHFQYLLGQVRKWPASFG